MRTFGRCREYCFQVILSIWLTEYIVFLLDHKVLVSSLCGLSQRRDYTELNCNLLKPTNSLSISFTCVPFHSNRKKNCSSDRLPSVLSPFIISLKTRETYCTDVNYFHGCASRSEDRRSDYITIYHIKKWAWKISTSRERSCSFHKKRVCIWSSFHHYLNIWEWLIDPSQMSAQRAAICTFNLTRGNDLSQHQSSASSSSSPYMA